ncbi:hypothetical protein OG870_17545 [Streptomyces sp. NBC_00461]|uniref:hypothetical protein n=1 Tax=Streptomyces sp. NBC_00461 TaxID=2975750 RepID=UPI002E18B73C
MSEIANCLTDEIIERQHFGQAVEALRNIIREESAPWLFSDLQEEIMRRTGLEKWPARQAIWNLVSRGELSSTQQHGYLVPR